MHIILETDFDNEALSGLKAAATSVVSAPTPVAVSEPEVTTESIRFRAR
jgi:hypothetical protein